MTLSYATADAETKKYLDELISPIQADPANWHAVATYGGYIVRKKLTLSNVS